jgi:hypothetical protein
MGVGGCSRDDMKENLNKLHKMAKRLVGVPEEMTARVKQLYQMMNYGWRKSLLPMQVLLRPC